MKISDIVNRPDVFTICETGAKIPWNDPEFSKRMLKNHLSQEHDWASRSNAIIRRHTDWIAGQLSDPKARILDLGCGPGLYTHMLAQGGYSCVGVDFGPASIEYARERAKDSGLDLEYVLSDVRDYRPQGLFDLVMMVFGELNEFSQEDALLLLFKAANCLKPGGKVLLEIQTPEAIYGQGQEPPTWEAVNHGTLTEGPYVCLTENAWDELNRRSATRWHVIKENGEIMSFASCTQSYDKWEFRKLLSDAGLGGEEKVSPEDWPTGEAFDEQLETYICHK